ncbi:MAG: leucyl aminopeptidase family protein, partial [Alphaproteobacteria bacterium]
MDCFSTAKPDGDAIVIEAVAAAGLDEFVAALPEPAANWLGVSGFRAERRQIGLIPATDGALAKVLFGLGDDDGTVDLGAGSLPVGLPRGTYRLGGGFADAPLAATAWALGAYRFDRYRESDHTARQLCLPAAAAAEITLVAEGIYLARDLINTPANELGPAELGAAAAALAARHGATCTELVGDRLKDGFPLIHAVGAAASEARAPRLIELNWGEPDAPAVTLVGKGVCFDTGGLDIKPTVGMALMKKDMGGAAAVLGLAAMIMAADLPVRLRVLIPAVENAIAGGAFRPGDIFRSRQGLTVEIGNTDAEGRLVLADALALACEDEPDLVIDLATLTGAARVALGPDVVPFYTRDDALAAALAACGAAVADPMWRMPLWQPYARLIRSKVADINNAGNTPFAGSVTAALFLSRFVDKATNWLHGDIFGWTPADR